MKVRGSESGRVGERATKKVMHYRVVLPSMMFERENAPKNTSSIVVRIGDI